MSRKHWAFDNSKSVGWVDIEGDQITVGYDSGKMGDVATVPLARYLDEPEKDSLRSGLAFWAPEISGEVEREARRILGRAPAPGT